MKKLMFTLLLMVAVLFALPENAQAATYGDLTYEITNGEVTITDCNTSATGDLTIPDTIEGYPVTCIGDDAFEYCRGLTSITVPDCVTSIGEYAFSSCDNLRSVAIPNSVISIGEYAFCSCDRLVSVDVAEDNAYYSFFDGVLFNKAQTELIQYFGANPRESYRIPDSVTSIGSYAFFYCSGLTSITIPDSVTGIGSGAFSYCSGLTSITIPDSVTSIESSAFYNCSGLTSITIPNSVTSIGGYAFSDCSGLTSVTLSNSITSIDYYAFSDCSGLTSVIIPNSVISIGKSAFSNCTGLTSITIPNSVTTIDEHAFYYCRGLTSLTIPNSVISIGQSAFSFCSSLTNITIPNSVKSIGEFAFYNCSSLAGIWVDDDNAKYSSDANGVLYNKSFTKLLKVPDCIQGNYEIQSSVTYIDSYAFYSCDNLSAVTMPASITSIGKSAFYGCDNLSDVYYKGTFLRWPEIYVNNNNEPLLNANIHTAEITGTCGDNLTWSLESSGTMTISGTGEMEDYESNSNLWQRYLAPWKDHLSLITTVVIEEGVTSIGDYTFINCSNLANVTISESVTSIGEYAFSDCISLSSIIIPNSIERIEAAAFADCNSLTSVVIPDSVSWIGWYAFENCKGLEEITIGNVEDIGEYAFSGCSKLKKIRILNGVTTLPNAVFLGCSKVENMILPASLSEIRNLETFFNTFTDSDFTLWGAPGAYTETLACEYGIPYKYDFSGIHIEEEPKKKVYFTNEQLDLDGIIVWYDDEYGNASIITDYTVSGFDNETGNKSITLSYRGDSASFTVCVVDQANFAGGHGTQDDPFLISSVEELRAIEVAEQMYDFPFYYQLTKNITLPYNWTAICDLWSFTGTLDGNGYSICNLTASSQTIGVFSSNKGTIKNLTVRDVKIGTTYTSQGVNIGCVALYNYGTIQNCTAIGNIDITIKDNTSYGTTINAYIGGICASNSGIITDCQNQVSIKVSSVASSTSAFANTAATVYAGGIVGYCDTGKLLCNDNKEDVSVATALAGGDATNTRAAYAGGIAAYSNVSIEQCKNSGWINAGVGGSPIVQSRVNVTVYAGGIAGDGATCTNCYNTGKVYINGGYVVYRWSKNGTWEYETTGKYAVGGIAGSATASKCYNTGTVSGLTTGSLPSYYKHYATFYTGEISGSGSVSACYSGTDAAMKQQSTYVGFDFTRIWIMGGADGASYPELRCFGNRLNAVSVSTLPHKLTYLDCREELDVTGGMLTLYYGDGTTKNVKLTNDMVTGFDNTIIGKQRVSILYLGLSASFEVEVFGSTIVFKDYDGTILSSQVYGIGQTVISPRIPIREPDNTYTYTFAGWNQEVVTCQGDATYIATYNSKYIDYTVQFLNWDGAVISRMTYHYGDPIAAPSNMGKPADHMYSYQFVGWDQDVSVCVGSAVYSPVFKQIRTTYTVTFTNYDGSIIASKQYYYGDTVEIPVVTVEPSSMKLRYYFVGWDKPVTECTSDATYTAEYLTEYIDYTVEFRDWDGSILSVQKCHYEDALKVPDVPIRISDAPHIYNYVFAGWGEDVTSCRGDAVYIAEYDTEYVSYTVEFRNWDGAVISSHNYHYGEAVVAPDDVSRSADQVCSYTFAGWDREITACQGNATYTAQYSANYIDYTVTFKNWDGSVISSGVYHYGDKVVVPVDPIKEEDSEYTYTFDCWDKEITAVTDSVVYIAIYSSNEKPVADGWVLENGKWVYYENGSKVCNTWKLDSNGWCYLTADGSMATNQWIQDSQGWCYVDGSGYCVTNCWMQDSTGWCYLNSEGRMATNTWILDSVGWCYVGADGYCVTNCWMQDSQGWVYLDAQGRMVTNSWIMDSVGWCYLGEDGYAVTDCWKQDSVGWCYLNSNGSMTKNQWVQTNGNWYYLDANGYRLTNTEMDGGWIDANGIWTRYN